MVVVFFDILGIFKVELVLVWVRADDEAQQEFERYTRRGISILTWMELQMGSRTEGESDVIDLFLREFRVIEITRQVARRAAQIRRRTHVRLPDAIIWATAQMESAQLVTRNTKDFPKNDPAIRIPY